MKRFFASAVGALLFCGVANAQLALPGAAAPDSAEAPAKAGGSRRRRTRPLRPRTRAGADAVAGQELLLNGADGELRISGGGKDKSVQVEKFTLMGEVDLRPHAEMPHRHRRRCADRGQEPGNARRARALFRRYSRLPADLRRSGRRGPRAAAGDRLRVSGRRLSGEPRRPLGACGRIARKRRQGDREGAGPRGRLDLRQPPAPAGARQGRFNGGRYRESKTISPRSAPTSVAPTPKRPSTVSARRGSRRRAPRCCACGPSRPKAAASDANN